MNKLQIHPCTVALGNPIAQAWDAQAEEGNAAIMPPVIQVSIWESYSFLRMNWGDFCKFMRDDFDRILRNRVPADFEGYAYLDIEPKGPPNWLSVLYGPAGLAYETFKMRIRIVLARARELFPKVKWSIWGLPRTPGKGGYPENISGNTGWMREGNERMLDLLSECDWLGSTTYERCVLVRDNDPRHTIDGYTNLAKMSERIISTLHEGDRLRIMAGKPDMPLMPYTMFYYSGGPRAGRLVPEADEKVTIGAIAGSGVCKDVIVWSHPRWNVAETAAHIPGYVKRQAAWLGQEVTT